MTQKLTFTKEKVVEAAFAMVREQGWSTVTARSIAKRLGSSTMPIYSSLRSMDEIARAVWEKATRLQLDYQTRAYTDNAALNIAIGYVAFAKNEPRLFRFMYAERPASVTEEEIARGVQAMREQPGMNRSVLDALGKIPSELRSPLAFRTWIFTHGLATLVSGGSLDIPEERIRSLLEEAGGAFYVFFEQKGKGGTFDEG